MSALSINALLTNQTGGLMNHNLAPAASKVGEASTMIHRKHYSDSSGGHHHHYTHEYSGHPYTGHHTEKKSRNIALTALTLLSFLFFLHILQQCLHDQMDDMNPQVVIMQARIKTPRESEAKESDDADKRIDESSEKTRKVPPENNNGEVVPPFKRRDDEYEYDKMQIPVKLRSTQSYGRRR